MTDERLVERAEKIVYEARAGLGRHGDSGRTQLSNAIDVAKTTQHPQVFNNWLRYQRAREEFWRISVSAGTDIAKETHQTIELITSKHTGEEAMKVVVRFLGFLRRALVAKDYFEDMPAATAKGDL